MRILIVGASSGIGHEVAKCFINDGYTVGVAARREEKLQDLKALAPNKVYTKKIDICAEDAGQQILQLAEKMGGIDTYLHVAGIGFQNKDLVEDCKNKCGRLDALHYHHVQPL